MRNYFNVTTTTMLSLRFLCLFILTFIFDLTWSYLTCPEECTCGLDIRGRTQTICTQGGMEQIPINDFDESIEVLIIRGPENNVSIGPVFQDFKRLEIVRITDSNIPSVGMYTFWGVPSLRILDLSRNNIHSVLDENFHGQENLQELDLSHNKINSLTSWVFRYLVGLRRLNLAHNSIGELVPRVFYMVKHLKYLDISGNPLNELPPAVFEDIMELKELRCRRCNLTKINPVVYSVVPHLSTLDLGDNNLHYLELNEFKNITRLTTLHLDGNQLAIIVNEIFDAQKSLEFLDLSRNRLVKITNEAFVNLANLTSLDVSYNKLIKLASVSVEPLRKLQALNISGNIQMDLNAIRETFRQLRYLKTLFVADMGPMPINLFSFFDQLSALNLSGNHLVNNGLKLLQPVNNLELLDLSRNQLTGFDDTAAFKLQKIRDVKMENNPLICDRCHMGSLIQSTRMLQWNIYPVCYLPTSLHGKPISYVDPEILESCIDSDVQNGERHVLDAATTSENFLEKGNINVLAAVCGIIFILIAVVILISVLSFSRHSARYYTHEEKRDDGSYEKSIDPVPLSITASEISFKFPIDDRLCTIDDMMLPPPPPSPPLISFARNNNRL